jgi:hypothetical protein
MGVKFGFPQGLAISPECQDLIARIFVASPQQRITIAHIRRHPWFLRNLPAELAVSWRRAALLARATVRLPPRRQAG